MDKLDFLDTEDPTATETAEPAAQAEPSPSADPAEPNLLAEQDGAKPERLRGPDGKFAARARDDEIMVPLKALHETRDEVRDLKARLAQFDQPQPDFAPHIPDMFEDPDGYTEWQNQQMSRAIYAERYNTSLRFAEQQHGQEAVQQAVDWAAQRAAHDPQFNLAALSQPDPVSFAIDQYQREQIVAQVDSIQLAALWSVVGGAIIAAWPVAKWYLDEVLPDGPWRIAAGAAVSAVTLGSFLYARLRPQPKLTSPKGTAHG